MDNNANLDRLSDLERNLASLSTLVYSLERTVGSLIASHPRPDLFAQHLLKVIEQVTALHLYDEKVSDEIREQSRKMSLEFVTLANDEVARRLATHPSPIPPPTIPNA